MIKLPTIALIASLFLVSCGGGGDSDTTPPTIKVISPTENATIIGGNNIELNIEITDNRKNAATLPKAVFSWQSETTVKKVDDNFSPWTIDFTDAPITRSEVTKTEDGYKYNITVSIPTKTENEEYAPPGRYLLEVWGATDNAGNTTAREEGQKVSFNIEFPPL